MSWSFRAIGTVEKLTKALEKESEGYHGLSKKEFDAAKPYLLGLLALNVDNGALNLDASGHATEKEGNIVYSSCTVHLTSLGKILLD